MKPSLRAVVTIVAAGLLTVSAALPTRAAPAQATTDTIGNSNVSISLDLSHGVTLTSIRDRVTGHEYLSNPAFLFEFALDNGTPYQSNNGVVVDHSTLDATSATITAHATNVPLAFTVTLSARPGDTAIVARTAVTDMGSSPGFLRMVFPKIQRVVTPGSPADMTGAVPQEIGGVANLNDVPSLGMGLNLGLGLPTAMNVMELADVYDGAGGGGLFFADLDGNTSRGIAPLDFVLSKSEVDGFWTGHIKPNVVTTLPRLAIGVHHSGDWHQAVNYYMNAHRSQLTFPDTPDWLRDAGAIYSPTAGGSGGAYLYQQPQAALTSRITSFTQLPSLLGEAKTLGTDVVYLNDYWDGVPNPQNFPPYFNKGDYTPSATLGGPAALTKGIAALHRAGGHIVAYIEPYIIYEYAQIAKQKGLAWAGRDSAGNLDNSYQYYFTMVPAYTPWQDQVLSIVQRLVGQYGFDGVFLDSLGWQMNKTLQTRAEGVQYTSQEWNDGILRLTDRVRTAVRKINPEAVVLSETTSGPLAQHLDGGLSADFAWLSGQNDNKIIASPVRYGMPNVDIFSNGRLCAQSSPCDDEGAPSYQISNAEHLNQLNQVFAAGEGLALSQLEMPNADYVRKLVTLRQKYHDALVEGAQAYQPATGTPTTAAYFYRGTRNQVITVTNTAAADYNGTLALQRGESNTTWKDMLTGDTFTAAGTSLPIDVGAQRLRVLVRQGKVPPGPAPTRYPVTAYNPTLLSDTFDSGDLLSTWTAHSGTWIDRDGRAEATTTGTLTYDTRTGDDFNYRGDVTITDNDAAGLAFRLSDNLQQGYAAVLSTTDNAVQLVKLPATVIGTYHTSIQPHRTYRLGVSAHGADLTVELNTAPVIHATDNSYASGRFGFTNEGSTADFDNVRATAAR